MSPGGFDSALSAAASDFAVSATSPVSTPCTRKASAFSGAFSRLCSSAALMATMGSAYRRASASGVPAIGSGDTARRLTHWRRNTPPDAY